MNRGRDPFRRTRAAKEDAVRRARYSQERNRGHSSSWEGPRAPRSLPRRFTRERKTRLYGAVSDGEREARLRPG